MFSWLPVDRQLACLRPILVVDFMDEYLDVLRADSIRLDECFSDAGDQLALAFDVARRLLNGDDGHVQRSCSWAGPLRRVGDGPTG
jgi:hypothetical protein